MSNTVQETQVGKQCLTHYNSQHIQVRKDFLDLCTYDKSQYNTGTRKSGKKKRDEPNQECMAKILRLLETLTDYRKFSWQHENEERLVKKRALLKEPKEYRIELAYSTIVRLLHDTHGESTVRTSMATLIQRGYVIRYQKNNASTPFYVLNISLLQRLLHDQFNEEQSEGVLNVTPSSDDFLGNERVLNVTPKVLNVTPKVLNVTPKVLNVTPYNIGSNKEGNKDHNTGSTSLRENNNEIPSFSDSENETESIPSSKITMKKKEGGSSTPDPIANDKEPRQTPSASFFTKEEEETIWSVIRQAREILIADRKKQYGYEAENLASWTAPTKAQREQVTRIITILTDYAVPLAHFTPELIAKAWNHAVDTKKFADTVWKLGNLVNELPSYLAFHSPVSMSVPPQEEPIAQQEIVVSGPLVLWTRQPSCIRGGLEQYWMILEWMPEQEARLYEYGVYLPFEPEEIEQYKNLQAQSMVVAV